MKRLLYLILLCNLPFLASSQVCPPNIGFEQNSFANWELSAGGIDDFGNLFLSNTGGPMWNVHTINDNTALDLDQYGNFPISCPNGSGYSIRLGNDDVNSEAERVSYTFTIPANQNSYTIIFNYAVVLQNPNHQPHEQPKFRAEVFDITANQYINCASFEFIASASLPGFEPSPVLPGVFYKPWSPVTLNLSGYAGKTIRVEFTTNDCSQGGHFGYAYIDVDENCQSPIKGNVSCGMTDSLKLVAPIGFQSYQWYNANFTQVLGTSHYLSLFPIPPDGTQYAVIVTPYPGLGCLDTLFTTLQSSSQPINLVLPDSVKGCLPAGVNLNHPSITSGSSPGLIYKYYLDPFGATYHPQPTSVTNSTTVYVAATNSAGCRVIKPLNVVVGGKPIVNFVPVVNACPGTIDLTSPAHIISSDPGLTFTYWLNPAATQPVPNPTAVTQEGTYYVKAQNGPGCDSIYTLNVEMLKFNVNNVLSCLQADLTSPTVTSGSTVGNTYSYFSDAAGTIPLANPSQVTTSGTYYIKAVSTSGCSIIKPVLVTIEQLPDFTVVDPPVVDFPEVVNLTQWVVTTSTTQNFTYWKDSLTTQAIANPKSVRESGNYFVKATTAGGCVKIERMNVVVNPAPPVSVEAPNAFSPNGDGTNDQFLIKIIGTARFGGLTIYNRWGNIVFETRNANKAWDGMFRGQSLPFGTYYWVFDGEDLYYKRKVVKNGTITIVK